MYAVCTHIAHVYSMHVVCSVYSMHVHSTCVQYVHTYVCMYTARVQYAHSMYTAHVYSMYVHMHTQELVLYTYLVNREKLGLSAVKDVQKKQNFNFLAQKDVITVKYVCVN